MEVFPFPALIRMIIVPVRQKPRARDAKGLVLLSGPPRLTKNGSAANPGAARPRRSTLQENRI